MAFFGPASGPLRPAHIATVAVIAAVAGLLAGWLYYSSTRTVDEAAVRELTQSPLTGVDGKSISIDAWRGKVVLVNFWATWCVPCKDEIPLLAQVQKDLAGRGLQVIGIALDNPDKVRQYMPDSPINYSVAVTGMDAINMVRGLGDDVGALPYSVILDRSGRVIERKLGAFHRDELLALLDRALR